MSYQYKFEGAPPKPETMEKIKGIINSINASGFSVGELGVIQFALEERRANHILKMRLEIMERYGFECEEETLGEELMNSLKGILLEYGFSQMEREYIMGIRGSKLPEFYSSRGLFLETQASPVGW